VINEKSLPYIKLCKKCCNL